MSGGEIAQIITSLATLVASAGAFILGWRNANKIEQVHIATNSMKDELVAVTAKASHAEGVKEEKDRQGN